MSFLRVISPLVRYGIETKQWIMTTLYYHNVNKYHKKRHVISSNNVYLVLTLTYILIVIVTIFLFLLFYFHFTWGYVFFYWCNKINKHFLTSFLPIILLLCISYNYIRVQKNLCSCLNVWNCILTYCCKNGGREKHSLVYGPFIRFGFWKFCVTND